MQNDTSSTKKAAHKKTFYGLATLIAAFISVLFLGGFFAITMLDITPRTFSMLNNLLGLIMCVFAPLTLLLGVLAFTRKNDSRVLSGIGMGLVTVPYVILFGQFVSYFLE
jgi:hypothetical protein